MFCKINNVKKSFLITLMAVCLLLSACKSKDGIFISTGLKEDELFKIGGSVCTIQEAELFLYTVRNQYESVYGKEIWNVSVDGQTLDMYIKDVVKQQLARIKCMYLFAKSEGIELEASQEQQIEAAANEYFAGLSQDEIEGLDMTIDDVRNVYREYLYAEKIYTSLTNSVNVEISDDDARIITIQYVRIAKNEENIDAKLEVAKKLKSQIDQGEDFMKLAVEHSDDNEYEIKVKRGDMPKEVESVIFELVNNEVSNVIQTSKSLYIVKCISDYNKEETAQNKIDLLKSAKEEAFNTKYEEYINTLPSEFNDELWNKISFSEKSVGTSQNFFEVYNKYFEN